MELNLPENYEYKMVENNESNFVFRIKNIFEKETALAWLSAYEEKSKFTWRKSRTYPSAGKIYVFREDYRCHHNTDDRYRYKNKRISKHTGCEATLKIKVKRFMKHSKSKYPDTDAEEYPCIVIVNNKHNHCQYSTAVLRFRDMTETTKIKLLRYFEQGFSASHARHALETELLLVEQDFESAKSDASLLPSLSVIQHLFNTEFSAAYGTRDDSAIIEETTVSEDEQIDPEEMKRKLRLFYDSLVENIENNPKVFLPAVKKMMENKEKCIKTENAMVSALHNFAKPSKHLQSKANFNRKRSGVQIPVQPTAIGRRKSSLTGKRSQLGGRPSGSISVNYKIKEHDYSPFNNLPTKREKAKHSISDCVNKNISVY